MGDSNHGETEPRRAFCVSLWLSKAIAQLSQRAPVCSGGRRCVKTARTSRRGLRVVNVSGLFLEREFQLPPNSGGGPLMTFV